MKGVGASIGYIYQAKREENLPDYFRLDACLSWMVGEYTIALNAYNLLDDYLYMGSMFEHNSDVTSTEYNYQVEAGINFRLGIAYKF